MRIQKLDTALPVETEAIGVNNLVLANFCKQICCTLFGWNCTIISEVFDRVWHKVLFFPSCRHKVCLIAYAPDSRNFLHVCSALGSAQTYTLCYRHGIPLQETELLCPVYVCTVRADFIFIYHTYTTQETKVSTFAQRLKLETYRDCRLSGGGFFRFQ